MSEAPALALHRFGVAFGDHVVLEDVTMTIPPAGITVLVGPAGAGKSTLLRTLAGLNDPQPWLRTWGRVALSGESVDTSKRGRASQPTHGGLRRIALVVQNARFYMASVRENLASALPDRGALSRAEQQDAMRELLREHGLARLSDILDAAVIGLPLSIQRRLAIVRAAATPAKLIMVDEPTAGLDPDDAQPVVDLLTRLATSRALLVVTHNQAHARALGGQTALLAGGMIRELRDTREFFEKPNSELARTFVRTGGCVVPAPSAASDEPPEGPKTSVMYRPPSRYEGPRGFYWLRPGAIGGCPRPGILEDLDVDLDALARLGVSRLVCLEERQTIDPSHLRARSLEPLHVPIDDMEAPSIEQATALCREIDDLIARGEAVAVHCRAGLGRTGTVLACVLIHEGTPALEALEAVRHINPSWVQSSRQIRFLEEFYAAQREGNREGSGAA